MPNRLREPSPVPVEPSSRGTCPASDPLSWTGSHDGALGHMQGIDPIGTAPPRSSLDHVRGDPQATRVLVEYGDYQCPYCAAAEPIVVEVLRRYDRGLMQVFRHFPLETIHPMARPAAEAAEFAGSHGGFWSMHVALMANSGNLSLPRIFDLATLLGHSATLLRDALTSGTCTAKVRRDFALGLHNGVQGTPTFFIDGALYADPVTADALVAALNRPAGGKAASPRILIRP